MSTKHQPARTPDSPASGRWCRLPGQFHLVIAAWLGCLLLAGAVIAQNYPGANSPFKPASPDRDGDGLADTLEDLNGNGRVDRGETDPDNADTDQDGALDGEEVAGHTDPLSAESWLPRRLAAWSWDATDGTWKLGDRGQAPLPGYAAFGNLTNGVEGGAIHFPAEKGAALRYALRESNGRLNARLDQGTIRLWFRPDWTWSERPLTTPRLFEVGHFGSVGHGWWAWVFRQRAGEEAAGIYRLEFMQNQGGGTSSRYWLPLRSNDWTTVKWHELAMAYHPQTSALFLDGVAHTHRDERWTYQTGEGVDLKNLPPARTVTQEGFSLGNDSSGKFAPLQGAVDSLETYNYPHGVIELFARQQLTIAVVTNAGARQLQFQRPARVTTQKPWPLSLWRRQAGETAWGEPLLSKDPRETFLDPNVTPGVTYEYKAVLDYHGNVDLFRHFVAGIDRPPQHRLGQVLLLVDETLERRLAGDLAQLRTNLVGDGWTVRQLAAPRHDDSPAKNRAKVAEVAGLIAAHRLPEVTNVVFLLGHVAVPYSGTRNNDGHFDHLGAWAADAYYGYLDKTAWKDEAEAANNRRDDGRFDLDFLPGRPDFAVGRVDFAHLPAFRGLSEVELIRRYLAKDFRYRTNDLPAFGRVSAHLGNAAAFLGANVAHSFAGAAFGIEPATVFNGLNLRDQVPADLGLHYRYGSDATVHDGVARDFSAAEFANPTREVPVVFRNVWFSYASDWLRYQSNSTSPIPNNWLRASLGWPRYGLATMGGVWWDFSPLGGGAPLAGCMTTGWQSQRMIWRFQSILGDPTLRLFRVSPPRAVKAARLGNTVTLDWEPPAEPVAGYFIYRSADGLDGFSTPLNAEPIPGTSFTDAAEERNLLYQVRAVKLQTTGSGSFHNLSQGAFAGVR